MVKFDVQAQMVAAEDTAGDVVEMHQAFPGFIRKSTDYLPGGILSRAMKLGSSGYRGERKMQLRMHHQLMNSRVCRPGWRLEARSSSGCDRQTSSTSICRAAANVSSISGLSRHKSAAAPDCPNGNRRCQAETRPDRD